MPYLPCMAIYAHLSGVLNARGRFVVSALAPSLLNIGTLVAVLPQHTATGAAIAAAWGALGSGVAQAALLWWGVRKSGARVDVRLPRLTPEIRGLIALAIPGAIAASATQINIFISSMIASQVPGGKSWLAVADRLYQLPLGLVGVAIGVALLPRLSTAYQAEDGAESQTAMDEAITLSMALTLPAAAALIAMPFFLIDALFTRGAFHAYDADQTARALFNYGIGTPAFVLARIPGARLLRPAGHQDPHALRFDRCRRQHRLRCHPVPLHRGGGHCRRHRHRRLAERRADGGDLGAARRLPPERRGQRAARQDPDRIHGYGPRHGGGLILPAALSSRCLLHRKELALVAAAAGLGVVVYAALLFGLRAITPGEIRGAFRRAPRKPGARPPFRAGRLRGDLRLAPASAWP